MTNEQALKTLADSLHNLQERKGPLNMEQLEAEVINHSCLEVLRTKRLWSAHDVTQSFVTAAKRLVPQYGAAQEMNALMGVPMNVQWPGMWEFLRNYFLANHGYDIDGGEGTFDAESKIFYSSRHKRFEFDQLVNDSEAERTIDILFTENRKVILVNVQPTLHSKKGDLTAKQGNRLVYTGADPDYRFTVVMDEIDEIEKFILEMPGRNLRLEYLEN